jgi:hypothetical protein
VTSTFDIIDKGNGNIAAKFSAGPEDGILKT